MRFEHGSLTVEESELTMMTSALDGESAQLNIAMISARATCYVGFTRSMHRGSIRTEEAFCNNRDGRVAILHCRGGKLTIAHSVARSDVIFGNTMMGSIDLSLIQRHKFSISGFRL